MALNPAGRPSAGLTAKVLRGGTLTGRRTVGTDPPVAGGPTEVMTPATADPLELVR